VFLTGGLGNQMFQTANALEMARGDTSKITFDSKSGNPRLNNYGLPEVYDYINFIPKESVLKANKVVNKIYRVNLLISSKQLSGISFAIRKVVVFISNLIISLFNRKIILLLLGNGIGYDKKLTKRIRKSNYLIIGYFQSYLFFNEKLATSIFQLNDISKAAKISEIIYNFNIREKVIIHVRRGDYVLEEDFGLLGLDYYSKAISHFKNIGFKDFIIFSDEVAAAKELFCNFRGINIEYFEELNLSSCETLELMSSGAGLVIANSTFSWWAGYLKKNSKAIILAPKKWFFKKSDPNLLIPNQWVRI
jgi:hypothetical protein